MFIRLVALVCALAFSLPAAAEGTALNAVTDVVSTYGPVLESSCVLIVGAHWCPTTAACFVSTNQSVNADPNNQAVRDACNDVCNFRYVNDPDRSRAEVKCTSYDDCEWCNAKIDRCGDCMFVGGIWHKPTGTCMSSIHECQKQCTVPESAAACNASCVLRDEDCSPCDRYAEPLRCTPQFPIFIVAGVVSSLCAVFGIFYVLRWRRLVVRKSARAERRARKLAMMSDAEPADAY